MAWRIGSSGWVGTGPPSAGWAFLDRPAVAVGVAEEHERVPWAAGAVDAVGALVVLDLADLDARLGQLGTGGLDVGDDQLQALDRAGGHLDDPLADDDRAGRPGRGQLHDVHVVADPGVVVDGEPGLLAVEALGPFHVGDRDDHHLELPVHAASPRAFPGHHPMECDLSSWVRWRSGPRTTPTCPRWWRCSGSGGSSPSSWPGREPAAGPCWSPGSARGRWGSCDW